MNDKIIVVCCGAGRLVGEATKLALEFKEVNRGVVIISDSLQKVQNPFEDAALSFHDFRKSYERLIFYENEPSKFISKPRNNFKKR
jgi:hypothetical protein